MRILGLLVVSGCATTTSDGELQSGRQRGATRPLRAPPEPARLEQHYCRDQMSTAEKLDCADFHDVSRNVRDAGRLWLEVAVESEPSADRCFAVHRISLRAPDLLERVASQVVDACRAQHEARHAQCSDTCSAEVPRCQERQRQFVSREVAGELLHALSPSWLRERSRYSVGAPFEEQLMQHPEFPACGREFSACVAACSMPRRLASN